MSIQLILETKASSHEGQCIPVGHCHAHIDGLPYNYCNSIFWRKWHFYTAGIIYPCPTRWLWYFDVRKL